MHIYSYPNAKNIVICGDIHGAFSAVIFKMCVQCQMKDTLLIIAGDCGFGFEKPDYYDIIFNRNSSKLSKANNWIVMVRGNHDNPAYFNEERIAHERFRTVPDYSVVKACGHNILCIGGAISIDRYNRQKYDNRNSISQVASYWIDEVPVYNEFLLNEISKEFKIDTVVTHTAPSFCEFFSKDVIADWAEWDPGLLADIDKERQIKDQIFYHLKSKGHPISHWYYGHFHRSWTMEREGVLFSMLDIMEFKEVR